jgi:hypothetical protein
MEQETESWFDPDFAAQILLEIAHEQSLEKLLSGLLSLAKLHPLESDRLRI